MGQALEKSCLKPETAEPPGLLKNTLAKSCIKPVTAELPGLEIKKEKAMHIANTADLSDCYLGNDTLIPNVEERGITVLQLGVMLKQITKRCGEESWTNFTGDMLEIDTVTLYDAVDYVILPATVQRECSFVELVAMSSQDPDWFVSHWWGEPVAHFIQCVTCHSRDRALGQTLSYWICAYANNQWQLDDALADDPALSSFHKALRKVQGTLAILDRDGVIFRRIWCGYETYTSLLAMDDFKYDIYTVMDKRAVGITDGFAACDGICVKAKHTREFLFPLSLGLAAQEVHVERAESSVAADRIHILNKIIGSNDLNMPIPSQHKCYHELNQTLHARFATSLIRAAVDAGDSDVIQRFLAVMPYGSMGGLMLNFWNCSNLTIETMTDVMHSLPLTLRSLHLNFKRTPVHCADVAGLLVNLLQDEGRSLTSLNLYDTAMDADSFQTLSPVLHQLQHLNLRSNELHAKGGLILKDVLLKPSCRLVSLNLDNTCIGDHPTGPIALAMGLAGNRSLTSLHLRWNDLAAHMEHIIAALIKNSTLQKLDLNYNRLSDEDSDGALQVNNLLDVLLKHDSLQEVFLEGNRITNTLPKIMHVMKNNNRLRVVVSEEEAWLDFFPRLVLVKADSPHRCIFKQASMLLSGQEITAELASHPGCAIVAAGNKQFTIGGEWDVLYLALGPIELAVTLSVEWGPARKLKKIISDPNGFVLFPQGGILAEGTKLALSKNKFDPAFVDEFLEILCFDVNEGGTISPAAEKNLVLGVAKATPLSL